jgi:hypothetical protein
VSDQETIGLDLIQKDLDGELSAAGKAELARLLLQDPDLRRLRDELSRTDALLRAVPAAEPPAGLRTSILSALGLTSRGSDRNSSSIAGWGRYRLAAAILGGVVVVGLGYRMISTQEDFDGLKGSIVAGAVAPAPADEVVLAVAGGYVTARLFREGDRTRLTLESSELEPVEVIGQYDPASMAPQGSAIMTPGSEPGRFSVILRAADSSASLEFAGSGAVRLEFRAGGQRLDTVVLGSDE